MLVPLLEEANSVVARRASSVATGEDLGEVVSWEPGQVTKKRARKFNVVKKLCCHPAVLLVPLLEEANSVVARRASSVATGEDLGEVVS